VTAAAGSPPAGDITYAAGLRRLILHFGLWAALIGVNPTDLAVGVPAAAAAAWVSLKVAPPTGRSLAYGALAASLLRLPWRSLVAGVDVARRALDPRMPLQTGFVKFTTRLPPGPAREAFRAAMSLQPGTLPVSGEADGPILFHCLDTDQPVVAQLAEEEARFLRILGPEPRDV
jgi:multicomponent Na+:H+ antiporter subunit E